MHHVQTTRGVRWRGTALMCEIRRMEIERRFLTTTSSSISLHRVELKSRSNIELTHCATQLLRNGFEVAVERSVHRFACPADDVPSRTEAEQIDELAPMQA